MRILYIDIDSLRPDHLSCYGYSRKTSPNIDGLAADGVRFENCYVSDGPCLPSRTAMFAGRFGIHTGVIGHGGTSAEIFSEESARGFNSVLGETSWMACLRRAGIRTATISPFAERHSAWHWYANFDEIHNTGRRGMERADEIAPVAIEWIKRNAKRDKWFLHVNLYDPHTPYRTPAEFGNPFKNELPPSWLSEEIRREHWHRPGPHSAQEMPGYDIGDPNLKQYSRQPVQASSMAEVKRMFDGYDTAVRYADEHVGRILKSLADSGVMEDTAIVISSDHGENLGELNIYGDHQTADHASARVPLIVRWPGVTKARLDTGLHYQVDLAATMIELVGGRPSANWDGVSFAESMRTGKQTTRPYLVLSQGAWTCQRAVRFDEYICIRTWHDGHHGFPDLMLFNVVNDPHEQHDLAERRPDLGVMALAMLDQWQGEMMRRATVGRDPMWTVMEEGGPFHTRGELPKYLERLKRTGRGAWAEKLAASRSLEIPSTSRSPKKDRGSSGAK